MKKYEAGDIRTLAIVGHGKSGKTSLGEALLYDAQVTNRLGKVDDATSNLDTEPEEIQRKSSMQLALGYCEWKKRKINFVDTPGDSNFAADAQLALGAVDAVLVVVSAPDGVQVGTERAWALAQERHLPAAIFINKLDRERASFEQALGEVKQALSDKAVPIQLPIGSEQAFSGTIDLLRMKAYSFEGDGRDPKLGEIPAALQDEATSARETLIEAIASTDDDLIEKYLDSGELSEEEISRGLSHGIARGSLIPVLCGAASRNLGVQPLLDLIAESFPSPLVRPPVTGRAAHAEQVIERKQSADGPVAGYVFKTVGTDLGRVALVRIISGTLGPDTQLTNVSTSSKERVGQIYALCGKRRESVDQAVAGDLIALAKLKDTHTGDTLCDDKEPIELPRPQLAEPVIAFALRPKSKGDEEKVATKLGDMLAEDTSLRLDRDPVTGELLLRGMGQVHIEMAVDKLKRLGVEVSLDPPKVAYRETIKGKATDVEGKHKKQSGGRGQFGVCYIDMEPKRSTENDDALEFVDQIFGGSIPRQFIASVEKGIRDRMARGVIAGYPVVNIKVALKDGKYHPVDSDGRSFEMAGSKGFQEAFKRANPVLLEPVMNLEVICPDENMGDIIGDVSSRRGKVLGTETRGRNTVVKAQVPQSEVLRYAIDLESITAGRGHFSLSFSHYAELPAALAEKVVAGAKVAEDED